MFAESCIGKKTNLIVGYGRPWGENIYYENTEVHDDAKLNHFTPHNIIDEKTKRRPFWFRKDEYSIPQLAAGGVKMPRAGGRAGPSSPGPWEGLRYPLGNGKRRPRRRTPHGTPRRTTASR